MTADLERSVDNARMRQITGGHAADMTKLLQNLVAMGVLNQEGQGRWTRYRLPASLSHSLSSNQTVDKFPKLEKTPFYGVFRKPMCLAVSAS